MSKDWWVKKLCLARPGISQKMRLLKSIYKFLVIITMGSTMNFALNL